jgi:hypothetical protein
MHESCKSQTYGISFNCSIEKNIKSNHFEQQTKDKFKDFARVEFRKNLDLNKKDFSTIEFLLRKGNRQLEIYDDPGIKNILTLK